MSRDGASKRVNLIAPLSMSMSTNPVQILRGWFYFLKEKLSIVQSEKAMQLLQLLNLGNINVPNITFFEVILIASVLKASAAWSKSSCRAGQQLTGGFKASSFLNRRSLSSLNNELASNLTCSKAFPFLKLIRQ